MIPSPIPSAVRRHSRCDIVICVEDARHLMPYAKHLLASVMRIRVRADEFRFLHHDVRRLLVRQGNWFVAELPAPESMRLVPLFQGFLRGALTFGIRLRASQRQLLRLVARHPFLKDILETIMNAEIPTTTALSNTFVACPPPSPTASAPAVRPKPKVRLGKPRLTGWQSPCCAVSNGGK